MAQLFGMLGDGADLLVSGKRGDAIKMRSVRWCGQRRRSAGACRKVEEVLHESADGRAFLPGSVGDLRLGEHAPDRDLLLLRWWFIFLEECRLADLGCGKFFRAIDGMAISLSADVPACQEREQRTVDRVLRPTERRLAEVALDLAALGAGSGRAEPAPPCIQGLPVLRPASRPQRGRLVHRRAP